jgi:hypothetical protein
MLRKKKKKKLRLIKKDQQQISKPGDFSTPFVLQLLATRALHT